MPGSVATFATCSSDLSACTSGSSALDAYTMPGTRIRPGRGMRNRYGVSAMSSMAPHVDGDRTRPAIRVRLDAQLMQGDSLWYRAGRDHGGGLDCREPRPHRFGRGQDLGRGRDLTCRFHAVDGFVEHGDEQVLVSAARHVALDGRVRCRQRPTREAFDHSADGFGDAAFSGGGPRLDAQIRGVRRVPVTGAEVMCHDELPAGGAGPRLRPLPRRWFVWRGLR